MDGSLSALDGVTSHDAANTAVAKSMLRRMTDDVAAFAASANDTATAKLRGLEDSDLRAFFANKPGSETRLRNAATMLNRILEALQELRDGDSACVNDVSQSIIFFLLLFLSLIRLFLRHSQSCLANFYLTLLSN